MRTLLQAIGLLFVGFVALVVMLAMYPLPKSATTTTAQTTQYRDASSVVGSPSISADFINMVLCKFGSPGCNKGQTLYDYGVKYNLDPAFALGFYFKESTFGTAGMARITLALSNERCIDERPCVNTYGLPCEKGQSCYAKFYSLEDGFEGWFKLIRYLYVNTWHLTTVDTILPRYAPSADNNNPLQYAYQVKAAVALWRAGKVAIP
jgi:hypothetical protein